ncbi:right-handed parallel beta-helix repeat-containing protein [Salinibacterium sp. ZJ450]|uniref:right-handed parallel beta-helix repeat-containing protein n=1 Tax=Salinibacterium sp. ZJ450 TaxID=2708338 RepID=UPI00141E2178|nr:right-handed parallel beta-helix repeat-containing protein [Salinibacterium sp. ZJ450]
MSVRAELTPRRLLVALLLLALLPAVLAISAAMYSPPQPPPGPPAYNPVPLPKDGILNALQARELQRSRRVTANAPLYAAALYAGPQLLPAQFPEPIPTILLPPRAEPYSLTEVQGLLPDAFETMDNAVLLRASLEIPDGARLIIDGAASPELRLLSSPDGFATIIARGGTLDVRGTRTTPLKVSSWDPVAGAVDENPDDGRSFILTLGGRMDIAYADIGYLGFGTGTSSGMAWRGAEHVVGQPPDPALGDVSNSVLHNNWFGAYTYEARGMRWIGNTLANNTAYGFDPHDLSNDFLVEGNVAHGNGRHGFIFSRGCDRNVLRDNVAYDNRGHGFMIDDGRTEGSEYGAARRLPSNDNTLIRNHSYDNDGSGIEIEGGSGTVIVDNLVERNHVGVRVKNGASAFIHDNRLVDNALAGVDVLANAGRVTVAENVITGGWASIALSEQGAAALTNNHLQDASAPMAIAGEAVRDEDLITVIGRVFRWNPLLVLWAAILGIPAVLGLRQLARVRPDARVRRHPR